MLKNAIRQAALEATGIVRAHRRHIHLNPEPSFSEEKTGAYVARALNEMGIVHSTGWCADGAPLALWPTLKVLNLA